MDGKHGYAMPKGSKSSMKSGSHYMGNSKRAANMSRMGTKSMRKGSRSSHRGNPY